MGIDLGSLVPFALPIVSIIPLVLFWTYPLRILYVVESAKLNQRYCQGLALEIDTVRYQTLKKYRKNNLGLKAYQGTYIAVLVMILALFLLVWVPNMMKTDSTSTFFLTGAYTLLTVLSIILWGVNNQTKELHAYFATFMIIVTLFVSVFGFELYKVVKQSGNQKTTTINIVYVLQHVFIIALLLYSLYLPFMAKKLDTELQIYESYLREGHAIMKQKTQTRTSFDSSRMPGRIRDIILDNIRFIHPTFSIEDAEVHLNKLLASSDPLESPLIYIAKEKTVDIRSLFGPAQNKDDILYKHVMDHRYRFTNQLNGNVEDAVKFIRGTFKAGIVLLSFLTFAAISMLYHKLSIPPIVLLTCIVGFAGLAMYISSIINNTD